jgi:endonuclease/exonuclease/phosphatase family metal-dependent hydrolase
VWPGASIRPGHTGRSRGDAPVVWVIMQALIGPATDDRLHVMTYNLRFPADDPGHYWDDRRPAMAALVNRERPTVIGTQEGRHHQLRDLAAELEPGYAWLGVGREGGSHGEFAAVFYDTARLDPVEYHDMWLSDTPDVIGSTTWGNRAPRMATWVRFADRSTGRHLVILNTHLDNHVENARRRGAELLAETVAAFGGLPIVVTGDFNALAGSSVPYSTLINTADLTDAWVVAERRLTPEFGTFAGYRDPVVGAPRIDWILTSPHFVAEVAAINPSKVDDRYPSDHLPVHTLLRWA